MPNSPIDKTCAFIKEKRQALGWDQKKLAIEAFDDPKKRKFISLIESGNKKGLTLDTLGKILTAMNCDIEFREFNNY